MKKAGIILCMIASVSMFPAVLPAQTALPKGVGAKVLKVYLSDTGSLAWMYKDRAKGSKTDQYFLGTGAGTSGPYAQPPFVTFSDDGKTPIIQGFTAAGLMLQTGSKTYGPIYSLFTPTFAADGTPTMYLTEQGSKYWLHTRNAKSGPFDDWAFPRATAKDAQTLMYVVRSGDSSRIQIGGRSMGPYSYATEPAISADGRHFGYFAREQKYFTYAYIDGTRFGPYNSFGSLRFAPSGNGWAYTARSNVGWKWFIYSEGFEAGPFDMIGGAPLFTPDGKTLVFASQTGKEWFIHRGKTAWGPYDGFDKITWFPAKQEFVYQMRKGNDYYICVGAEKTGPYATFGDIFKLSGDGESLLYTAKLADGWYAFCDGSKTGPFDEITRADFIDGTHHVAVRGRVKFEEKLYLDGKLVASGLPGWCALSSDGKTAAHWEKSSGWHAVLGKKKYGPYQYEGTAVLSADGKDLQCTGEVGDVEYTHLYVGQKRFIGAVNREGKRAYVQGDVIIVE